MTWKAFHNRGETLRSVIATAAIRRDGVLPMDIEGVAETFADELDLIGALQLKWHTRLAGQVERIMGGQPLDLDAAVAHDEAARALEAKGDLFSKAKALGHKLAIGLKIASNLLMKPQRTTDTSRWQGLDGFPNYPGQLSAT